MKKTVAVVVTFNRKELLRRNLAALLSQTHSDLDIMIIDNASTDGTREYVDDIVKENNITYVCLKENIGGAGGFNYGIKKAAEDKYDYIWLMDDDTIPEPDALEKLFCADALVGGSYGFLSGMALWRDGTPCRMNRQKLIAYRPADSDEIKKKLIRTNYATFVSFFLKAETVKKVGLPIKEFFIWGDDVEYSTRIADHFDCYVVKDSIVLHDTQNNAGSDIVKDDSGRLMRYRFAYRNEVYIAKKRGFFAVVRQLAKILYHTLRIVFISKGNRIEKLKIVIKSSFEGISFNPSVEHVKD